MTEQEAIKELRAIYAMPNLLTDNELMAFEIAIKALKRQIPKEAMPPTTGSYCIGVCCCPTCKKILTLDRLLSHCYFCGQKLDWSDEDEID